MYNPELRRKRRIVEIELNIVAENVSVAGLKETLVEHVIWIRNIFRLSLIIISCYALYCSYYLMLKWKNSGYRDELEDKVNQEFLPFSNVTICAQVYYNNTFIKSNITVPKEVAELYIQETGLTVDDLYDQFSLFLAITTQPREFSLTEKAYFTKIYRANPQLQDLAAFISAALPPCRSIFKKCYFEGVEFDCCEKAVQSLDENGVCYLLALNHDSDNAIPNTTTINQRKPGPLGGLTVEASMSVEDYPMFGDDTYHGFLVYVNPVPYSSFQSPLGAPHGAETFIKVVAAKRSLDSNCAKPGRLVMKGGTFMYYDPEGLSCVYRAGVALIRGRLSCDQPYYLYRPNATTSCDPFSVYMASSYLWKDNATKVFGFFSTELGAPASRMWKIDVDIEEGLKAFMSQKSTCPKHCTYWTYQSSPSFVLLEQKDGGAGPKDIMYSKIHVFYPDLAFREHREAQEKPFYVAFCDLGSLMDIYWGMSLVSIFHLLYYIPRCLYILRKSHTQVGQQ